MRLCSFGSIGGVPRWLMRCLDALWWTSLRGFGSFRRGKGVKSEGYGLKMLAEGRKAGGNGGTVYSFFFFCLFFVSESFLGKIKIA